MEVSKKFLCKALGEDICNLLICRAVLQNYGPAMHQLSDVVHVNLYLLSIFPSNWICGDIISTFIVTKYDFGQSTTNLKL